MLGAHADVMFVTANDLLLISSAVRHQLIANILVALTHTFFSTLTGGGIAHIHTYAQRHQPE